MRNKLIIFIGLIVFTFLFGCKEEDPFCEAKQGLTGTWYETSPCISGSLFCDTITFFQNNRVERKFFYADDTVDYGFVTIDTLLFYKAGEKILLKKYYELNDTKDELIIESFRERYIGIGVRDDVTFVKKQ